MNKIISYIGFAIKSNNYVAGQTALKHSTKSFHLIIVCNTASENLKNLAKNLAEKNKCDMIISQVELESLTNIKDIKIARKKLLFVTSFLFIGKKSPKNYFIYT